MTGLDVNWAEGGAPKEESWVPCMAANSSSTSPGGPRPPRGAVEVLRFRDFDPGELWV